MKTKDKHDTEYNISEQQYRYFDESNLTDELVIISLQQLFVDCVSSSGCGEAEKELNNGFTWTSPKSPVEADWNELVDWSPPESASSI